MSALHLSAAFYAYTLSADMSPQKCITCSTLTSDPIGLSRPSVPIVTEDQTDFTDSGESEAFALAIDSEKQNFSQ